METTLWVRRKGPLSAPRRSERVGADGVAFVVASREDRKAWRKALMLDRSAHGARVQTDIPLTSGEVLEFVPPVGEEYAIRCRVIWAGEVGSDSEGQSGLEFLTPYPTDLAA
jgi:hypothetical protein